MLPPYNATSTLMPIPTGVCCVVAQYWIAVTSAKNHATGAGFVARMAQSRSRTASAKSPATGRTLPVPTETFRRATGLSRAPCALQNAKSDARTPGAPAIVPKPVPRAWRANVAVVAIAQIERRAFVQRRVLRRATFCLILHAAGKFWIAAVPVALACAARFKCGTADNKAMVVDMIMFETYEEIDLDVDPCIFTSCGHIFTLKSMDGIMDMQKHYEIDPTTDNILGLKTTSEPFSSTELKVCPTCRGSLRDLARYGRIVRRALLDESAKKLTAWSDRTYAGLVGNLAKAQEQLLANSGTAANTGQHIDLTGRPMEQRKAVRKSSNTNRYRRMFDTRAEIQRFTDKLRKDEQPYQRVRDLVETARRENADANLAEFSFASSELLLREYLQGETLLIRCDAIMFSDVIGMHNASKTHNVLKIDFTAYRGRCEELIKESRDTHSVREEVEGQLFWAKFAAMECGVHDAASDGVSPGALARVDAMNKAALDRLAEAEKVCKGFAGESVDPTKGLLDEVIDVRRMLNEGVSTSEMRMVVAAMAGEFRGTGHWYRCANGHPFTIGECGMPMELARCPACGAGIGGQGHVATAGVQHARDVETQFGALRV
ncbi:hypothetical protein LTR27_006726 [Elasticomyces elasticus]|nr:hypothetical protein LTR27_006726 [Elasticomyces elasticus]